MPPKASEMASQNGNTSSFSWFMQFLTSVLAFKIADIQQLLEETPLLSQDRELRFGESKHFIPKQGRHMVARYFITCTLGTFRKNEKGRGGWNIRPIKR